MFLQDKSIRYVICPIKSLNKRVKKLKRGVQLSDPEIPGFQLPEVRPNFDQRLPSLVFCFCMCAPHRYTLIYSPLLKIKFLFMILAAQGTTQPYPPCQKSKPKEGTASEGW